MAYNSMSAAFATALAVTATAAPMGDKVDQLPGFNKTSFDVYSGYLTVPGPFKQNDYTSLEIHYQFQASQGDPSKDPIATWHQGGPGGSSINVGLYTEMGYFQIDDSEGLYTNPYAWNKVASMLYLESPAGSGSSNGYSKCMNGDKPVDCHWNDTSQAEAYAHTLSAFFKSFPEYAKNDLYLTGESYAGQYVPNIAHYILNNEPFNSKINLKGIALGNACWGGTATQVQCNGPNRMQNMADIYYGKGLSSKELYDEIYKTCKWPDVSLECGKLLEEQYKQVGPHNVYNIYDNCPQTSKFLKETGLSMYDLQEALNREMDTGVPAVTTIESQLGVKSGTLGSTFSGGYPWACGGMNDIAGYLTKPDVAEALHLGKPGASGFSYHSSGPASITLHPELARKLRVLIYNGDADACVPYKGNVEWITDLVKAGDLKEYEAWRPWYNMLWPDMPAGYVTSYNVTAPGAVNDFHFITIRLAGHMVPTFQPASSLAFIERFFAKKPF